jgi:hypothetical protein
MDTLILRTFFLNSSLSEEQIEVYNGSNSVIVSQDLFQNIIDKNHDSKVNILGLYYNNKKIYVDIIDSHNDDNNIMYIPLWIYTYFNYKDDDLVNYMQVKPITGNKIKIRPKGDFYAYLDDPVNALCSGFEKYSCLLENTTIVLNIQSIQLEVEILETYINSIKNNKNQPIYIRGIELEVDIESIESIKTEDSIKPEESNKIIESKPIDSPPTESKPIDSPPTESKPMYDFLSSMLPQSMIPDYLLPGYEQSKKFTGIGYKLT